MSNITFAEIMEFYPEHNRSVYEDLKKDYLRGHLIPFVGAGLSVFCGYLNWSGVLKQLAKFIFEKEKQTEIESIIDNGDLLQAAQEIYNNYPRMLKELKKIIDYEKIRNCDTLKLHTSAAYVLPSLFDNGLIMTTNFDRVLEEVYDRQHAKFGKVVTPYDSDLLTQIRQTNPHCLFKLHGDIGPEIHDAEKLVFTQTQYDKAYAADGPLMQELPHWFQNKKLLFLGCSLSMDKTMEVLQRATAKNPELDHYAILACKPEEIKHRTSEMGNLGISAIYYPSGKHDAVRVILERLLEETNYDAYEELIRHTRELVSPPNSERRFMYDSDYIAFTGRKEELAQLYAFCQSSALISWWAVTGPGGMGKSRLVHEFVKTQRSSGWKIYWLRQSDYNNLSQSIPPVDRCIVVADDVQAHLQAIGNWITSVSTRQRSEKLRILLLERDGKDLTSAKWVELLQADSPYDDTILNKCYCHDFLQLEPLLGDELKTIMENFAKVSGKPLADKDHAHRLLQTLQKIDGNLQRPIYALAIVDAWCCGKDPTRWNKEQVLDALVKRELKFYYERLRNISQKKITNEMRSEFENLLARSCLMTFLPLDYISDKEYPKLRRRANELDMDFHELLQLMGVTHKGKVKIFEVKDDGAEKHVGQTKSIEAVILDCPDLVKEYLVLRQAFDKGNQQLLLPNNWSNNPQQLNFLRRVLRDYPEKLEGKKQFWDEVFAGCPESDFPAWIYSDLMFGITVQLPKMGNTAMNRLEKMHEQFPTNEEIAEAYSKSLVNLSADQTLDDCLHSVSTLKLLLEQFPTNEEIAEAYAKSLVNLSADQTLDDCLHSVSTLKLLLEQFPTNEEIAEAYAKSLVNLSANQTLETRVHSVHNLNLLYEQFQTSAEIATVYAAGLVNVSVDQTLDDCMHSVSKLKLLHEQFLTNEEIAVSFSCSLVNLSFKQTTEADVQKTLEQSGELLTQYPKNFDMQLTYAQTVFNLTLQQSPDALQQTVLNLQEYLLAHPDPNKEFQAALDKYLSEHPEHTEQYKLLRIQKT